MDTALFSLFNHYGLKDLIILASDTAASVAFHVALKCAKTKHVKAVLLSGPSVLEPYLPNRVLNTINSTIDFMTKRQMLEFEVLTF